MNKLQSVLNDEESMKQIKELADMLTSEGQNGQAMQDMPQQQTAQPPADFSQLLQSLGGMMNSQPQSPPQSQPSAPSFDIAKIMKLQGIMQSASKPDKNIDLLMALRPLLKEENQGKIDRLVKIFKLFAIYPALKESGLLGGDLFGLL